MVDTLCPVSTLYHDELAMERRNITYLLVPGSCAKARAIARIAGGCRWTWNRVLADTREEYRLYRDTERFCSDTLIGMLYERPAKPSLSFFSLGKRFTHAAKRHRGHEAGDAQAIT